MFGFCFIINIAVISGPVNKIKEDRNINKVRNITSELPIIC